MRGLLVAFLTGLALVLTAAPAEAAPVLAFVTAIGSSLGAAFAGTALGGFLASTIGRILTVVALSALSRAAKSRPREAGITTTQTLTGGANPAAFVLGYSATAGDAVCPPMSHGQAGDTPNAYLTYVIALSDIAGQTLERFAIDGAWVDFAATSHATYGRDLTGRYAGYAWVRYYDGTQTAADPGLLAAYGAYPERPWTSDMIGNGICYAIVTFRYNREVFSGFPSVLFECGGIKVYDPRRDSTVGGSGAHRWGNPATYEASRNNAVLAYNVARGVTLPGLDTWGGGFDADSLPFSNWVSAMNTCDVTIGSPAVAQYRGGMEVRVDQEPASIIEELLKGCSGEVAEAGGQLKIRVGGPGLPSYIMTDDDVIVTKPQDFQPFPGSDARMNGIDAKYPDPGSVWATKAAPSRYNTAWETEDGGRRVTSLSLPACPYPDQVQRVMAAYIADERRHRKHQLVLPPDAAILEPLDVISWTSARNGYTSKQFDIAQIADDPVRILQQVSMREVDPTDYAWSPSSLIPVSTPSSQPVVAAAQVLLGWAVSPLVVTDDAGLSRRSGIVMTWSGATLDAVDAVQYQVRIQATGAIVKVGTVTDLAGARIPLVEGIVAGVTYEARAILVAPGRATSWTAWVAAAAPKIKYGLIDLNGSKRQMVIPGPVDVPVNTTEHGRLTLGALAQGSVWKRGISFEARYVSSGTYSFELQTRQKYAGTWSGWTVVSSWTITDTAWDMFSGSGTLSGAWEDFEYRLMSIAPSGSPKPASLRNVYLTLINVAN